MYQMLSSPQKLYSKASKLETKGKYQKALALFIKCLDKIEKRPERTDINLRGQCSLRIGRCNEHLRQLKEAKKWYVIALEKNSLDSHSLRSLKQILTIPEDRHAYASTLSRLQRIIQLKPELNWPQFRWAIITLKDSHNRKHQLPEAIEHLKRQSVLAEFHPSATLALGEAYLFLKNYGEAERCLKPLAQELERHNKDLAAKIVFCYAASLSGLKRFGESLNLLEPLIHEKKVTDEHLELSAYCYYAINEKDKTFAILQYQSKSTSLSASSRRIYLQLLLERGDYKKAYKLANELSSIQGDDLGLLSICARLLEIQGRTELAIQTYRLLIDMKKESLGFWAKILHVNLAKKPKLVTIVEAQSFVRCLRQAKWRIVEPFLESAIGAQGYHEFCNNFLKRLLLFLWQQQAQQEAFECAYALYRHEPSNLSFVSGLLFLAGWISYLNKKHSETKRFWDCLQEHACNSTEAILLNQCTHLTQQIGETDEILLQTTDDFLSHAVMTRERSSDFVLILSILAWFGKFPLIENILKVYQNGFLGYQHFKLVSEIQKKDFSQAFQTLAGIDISGNKDFILWVQHILMSLALLSTNRDIMTTALKVQERKKNGHFKASENAVLRTRLLWVLGEYDSILQDKTNTHELILLRSAAAIKLNRPQIALNEVTHFLNSPIGKNSGSVICQILQALTSKDLSNRRQLDAHLVERVTSKFLETYHQNDLQRQFAQAVLELRQLPAFSLILRQENGAILQDKKLFYHLGLAYYEQALMYENDRQFYQAVEAWRMVFSCWAQLFERSDFFTIWASKKRAAVYKKEIYQFHLQQAKSAIHRKLLNHFLDVAQNLEGLKKIQFKTTYRYLYYEFMREQEFIKWLKVEKIQVPKLASVLPFGPILIRYLGWTADVFQVLKRKTLERQKTGAFETLLFEALLGRYFGKKIRRLPAIKGKSFNEWKELFSTLGIAKVLIQSHEFQKAADYFDHLYCDNEITCKVAACRHRNGSRVLSLQTPCGACDTFTAANPYYSAPELHRNATHLAISAYLEMVFAELKKTRRDFDIVGRDWEIVLELAGRIREREKYRNQIVETCLAISQGYSKDKKYTIGIHFLEGCHKYLNDDRLKSQIAYMKNILAVAYSDKNKPAEAWKLITEVVAIQSESETYFSNYVNIALIYIDNIINRKPAAAQKIAQQAIEFLRTAKNVNKKMPGFTARQLCELFAKKFYDLADKVANENSTKALNLIGRGLKLGVRENYFLDSARAIIRQEYTAQMKKSQEHAAAYLQRLHSKYSRDTKILKVITEVQNTGAIDAAYAMIDSGDVLSGLNHLVDLVDLEQIDVAHQLLIMSAVDNAYHAGMVRDALGILADKCSTMNIPTNFERFCVAGYVTFISREVSKGRIMNAEDLFDDAEVYFPDNYGIVEAWRKVRNGYAVQLTNSGQFGEALEFFKKIYTEEPRNRTYRENLKRTYQIEILNLMKEGRVREAVDLTTEAQTEFPGLLPR